MKVKELLELTQTMNINQIAKDHLKIGEKPTRQALKNAGCINQNGKKGWIFNGKPEDLEKEIYEFSTLKKVGKIKGNNEKKEKSNIKMNNSENTEKTETIKKELPKNRNIKRSSTSFTLNNELVKSLKIQAIKEEKHIYEIVEIAIEDYLKKFK